MGGIASGAYFLVSPMLAVSQPVDPEMTIAAPVPARLGVAPIVAYLPPERHDRPTMGRIVVEQVRRQLEEQPEPVAALWTDDAAVGVEPETPEDHDAAVVAAHGQRIAILRERLAVARVRRVAAPQLVDLRARLRRAEAAQQLALSRAEVHQSVLVAARQEIGRIATAGDPLRLASASETWRSATPLPSPAGLMPEPPSTKRLLAHARQSLAAARMVLEAQSRRPQRTVAAPKIVIAGLLQWAGSDRWSLSGAERFG